MHFDDRLATVLRQRAGGEVTARIQYRQLLDLLGTMPVETQGPQVDAAGDRLADLSKMINAPGRAAILREPGLRLRNPRIIALLAQCEPAVAEAAIECAQLGEEEWLDLAPALPMHARALVRRRSNLGPRAEALFDQLGMVRQGLPSADADILHPPVAEEIAAVLPEAPENPDGIGAIVRRIEDFRKARQTVAEKATASDPEQLQLVGSSADKRSPPRVNAFDFATDPEGRIVWSDPGMAPMAVGLSLASRESTVPAASTARLLTALRFHQPISEVMIEITGAPGIAGKWRIDAAPRFDPQSGGFTGFAGRMRRPEPVPSAQISGHQPENKADRMRQLLHELRTPVNAIQGFAEIIQQQLFGPTPHEYRALAASIAADAARMLAGFEELDRLAKLETGTQELEQGECDFADVVAATVAQLSHFTETRGSGFALEIESSSALLAGIARKEAESLAWRLLATLAGAASPGEVLDLRGAARDGAVTLIMQLPANLASQPEGELLNAVAGPKALSAGMFGTGFTLRLATAEAQAAGGSLMREDGALVLRLPGLTGTGPDHSDSPSIGAATA